MLGTIEVHCPSGLRGTMRGMKTKDEELFADRNLVRNGKVISELLKACWQTTVDAGPYNMESMGGSLYWPKVTQADRTYLLIQLRTASYGPDFEFRVTCNRCGHHYGWGIKLDELDVYDTEEAGITALQTGEPYVVEVYGESVKCRLSDGEDEEFLSGIDGKDERKILTYTLARRIVEIEGHTHWKDILAYVEDMPARVADDLWNRTDDAEGGIDTMFDVECPKCRNVQSVNLPFGEGFFSTRKRFGRGRKKRGSTK